jgi:TRAP-type C4-dicarboxylate transport system permease small subunit
VTGPDGQRSCERPAAPEGRPAAAHVRGWVRAVNLYVDAAHGLSRACGVIAAVLLLGAVIAVVHLVVVRYALGHSAIWQYEFVTFSLIGATLIGSPYVLLMRGHVNIDLLPLKFSRRPRFVLAVIAALGTLAFCVVLTWTGYGFWHEAWAKGWRHETVWAPPLWVPYLSVPLGIGLLGVQALADLLALLIGREPPFGIREERV